MAYTAPTAEQKFVLQHIVGIAALAQHPRYSAADADMVDAIVEGIAGFAEAEYAPLAKIGDTVGARWSDGVVTLPAGFREAYQALVANGWGTLDGPTEFGGQSLPFALTTVVMEDLGSANLGFSLINMLTMGAIEALDHHGSPEQQAQWLPKIISGEWPATMNLTEPQAGSDVGALRTTATPLGDGTYRIKGQKIYITFGEHDLADNIIHLVLARTPGAPAGTKGISLFLVPKFRLDENGNPGTRNDVHCVSIEHKLGIHASPTCVLSFGDNDDCIGELVGSELGGMRGMFTMMNNARLSVGNQGVQIAEAATQMALAYAHDRVQTPRSDGSSGASPVPIIQHPDVRRMLLRMIAQTQAARALIYYAAGQVDRARTGDAAAKTRLDLVTPLAKAHGTDIGCEVASLGVQVHGGMGFIEETGAARHYRDARITPIYEGTNGIQAADLVGRKLAGDDGAGLRALVADIRGEAQDHHLLALVDAVENVAGWMLEASINDRLAGSYPFLTMLSTATCGWLMERQRRIATEMLAHGQGDPAFLKGKQHAASFYLTHIVPEAQGQRAAATAGAALLYEAELA
ncbi:MAG: acyl-CoA dehydrogenase [Sphingobium sp.]